MNTTILIIHTISQSTSQTFISIFIETQFYRGLNCLNKLSAELKPSPNLQIFQRKLEEHLFRRVLYSLLELDSMSRCTINTNEIRFYHDDGLSACNPSFISSDIRMFSRNGLIIPHRGSHNAIYT